MKTEHILYAAAAVAAGVALWKLYQAQTATPAARVTQPAPLSPEWTAQQLSNFQSTQVYDHADAIRGPAYNPDPGVWGFSDAIRGPMQ